MLFARLKTSASLCLPQQSPGFLTWHSGCFPVYFSKLYLLYPPHSVIQLTHNRPCHPIHPGICSCGSLYDLFSPQKPALFRNPYPFNFEIFSSLPRNTSERDLYSLLRFIHIPSMIIKTVIIKHSVNV